VIKLLFLASIAVAGAAIVPPAARAQYPARPVRLIVPSGPGGGTDGIARPLSQKLTELLGQQVVVDNRAGAGGNIGVELVAKSPSDGYTLLLATLSNAIGQSLYGKLPFDLARDFAPVTLLATTPQLLVVHPSLPVKTVKDLIAVAKTRPSQLQYSSAGNGTPTHLAGVLFGTMTGTQLTHVPYKGGGPSVIGILSGEVPLSFAVMPSVVSHVRAARLRGLAVSTAHRSRGMPEMPTISESGVPGYEVTIWYGLLVPTGTPREIIARLHAETVTALGYADMKERLDAAGFEPRTMTPEAYGAFTRSEIQKWAKLVKASGAKPD
jgi:tripartite-type tricarboxylate transporter receptor subunit TctC